MNRFIFLVLLFGALSLTSAPLANSKTSENISIENDDHLAYLKLVDDKLYLIIENKSKEMIKVNNYGGRVLKSRVVRVDEDGRQLSSTSPIFLNQVVHSVAVQGKLELLIKYFEKPKEKEQTLVELSYYCEKKKYTQKFIMTGNKFNGTEKD